MNESRWRHRKEGYQHDERDGDVDDLGRDKHRDPYIGDVLAQNMRCEERIATNSAWREGGAKLYGVDDSSATDQRRSRFDVCGDWPGPRVIGVKRLSRT